MSHVLNELLQIRYNDSPALSALCFSAATILSRPRSIVIPRQRNAESHGFWIEPGEWGMGLGVSEGEGVEPHK